MHSNEILTTFTIAAALGVCLFTLAYYLRTSAIVVLLIGGVLAGPEGFSIVNPKALGDGLGTIISLAVAIILFEGGLTLNLKGYRSVSREILRILTIGVLVTWLGTAVILKLGFGFDWAFLPACRKSRHRHRANRDRTDAASHSGSGKAASYSSLGRCADRSDRRVHRFAVL